MPSSTGRFSFEHEGVGRTVAYELFAGAEGAPAAIISHGFGRSSRKHRGLAEALVGRLGLTVVLWDMLPLVAFGSLRSRQLINVAALCSLWHSPLVSAAPRVALVGFSAGGAIATEAALVLQSEASEPVPLLLLDAVPWPDTLGRAAALSDLRLQCCSLRGEPSSWNAKGAVRDLCVVLTQAGALVLALQIVGASHLDFEADSASALGLEPGVLPRWLGLRSCAASRPLVLELAVLWLQHVLLPGSAASPAFGQFVEAEGAQGRLVREALPG